MIYDGDGIEIPDWLIQRLPAGWTTTQGEDGRERLVINGQIPSYQNGQLGYKYGEEFVPEPAWGSAPSSINVGGQTYNAQGVPQEVGGVGFNGETSGQFNLPVGAQYSVTAPGAFTASGNEWLAPEGSKLEYSAMGPGGLESNNLTLGTFLRDTLNLEPVKAALMFAGANGISQGALTASGAANASIPELASNFASGVGNTVGNFGTSLSNLVGGESASVGSGVSNTSLSDFLAADASQLAGQGIQGGQLETLLGQSGADAFTAADLAQLTGQGITGSQLVGLGNQAMQTVPQALGGASLGTGMIPVGAGAPGGAGTGAATAGATTLSQLLGVTGTGATALDALGRAIPGLIGAYAASEQGDAYGDLINADNARYQSNLALGAPSRSRYEASFAPGFDISQDPALQGAMDTTTQTLLRQLSTQGNPYGNPSGLAEVNKYVLGNVALPYLQNYRNQNASTGGYGAFNTSAASGPNMNLAGAGVNADSNVWGGLGGAAADVFTPRTSLSDLLKGIKGVLA
jgi:hypothetical protein